MNNFSIQVNCPNSDGQTNQNIGVINNYYRLKKMLVCNKFEISMNEGSGIIEWEIQSDLPDETIVSLNIESFFPFEGGGAINWNVFEDRILLQSIGSNSVASGKIDISDGVKVNNAIFEIEKITLKKIDVNILRLKVNEVFLTCRVNNIQKKLAEKFGRKKIFLTGSKVRFDGDEPFVYKETTLKMKMF